MTLRFWWWSLGGCAGSVLLCGFSLAAPSRGCPLLCSQAAPGVSHFCCRAQALECGSVVRMQPLSYSPASGVFPNQRSNPCPLHWQAVSYPLHHQGSPTLTFFESGPVVLSSVPYCWLICFLMAKLRLINILLLEIITWFCVFCYICCSIIVLNLSI